MSSDCLKYGMEHVSLARFAYVRHFENEIPLLINRGREMSPISGNESRRLKLESWNLKLVKNKTGQRILHFEI